MTVSNHAITATNLALALKSWWVLPIALFSHFVLDTFPHYGAVKGRLDKLFWRVQKIDAVVLVFVFGIVIFWPGVNTLLLLAAAVVACSPDVLWVLGFLTNKWLSKKIRLEWFDKFHTGIAKLESTKRWPFDIVWFSLMLFVFLKLV